MKKILIAILLLVPLIIVFTLNTSASIVSAQIEIGVERMVLTHQGQEVSYVVINLEEYIESNKKYTLFVDFTPTYVSNKDVEWRSTDTSVAKVRKQGSGASVTFQKGSYGSVEIIATATSNTSISASCTFYVTGNQLGRIELYEYKDNQKIDNVTLGKNESKQIGAKVLPAGSLGNAVIDWESSDENVVKVDSNGVLTAVKQGVASISASVERDDIKVSSSIDVTVTDDQIVTQTTIYTQDNTLDVSRYLTSQNAQITDVSGATLSGQTLSLNQDEAWLTLSQNGRSVDVLIKRQLQNTLVLDNYASFKKGMWYYDNYVAVGSNHVTFNVTDEQGEDVPVVWSSSDENVAYVNNGRVVGVSHGKAVLTATAQGYLPLEIPVVSVEKLGDINLAFSEVNDVAGLAEERVFGIYTCDENLQVSNALKLGIASTYPASLAEYSDFSDYLLFDSDNEELATVDKNGYVHFTLAAIGKSVKITVRSKFSDNDAQDSYTFKVVDGINIGVGVTAYYDKTVSTTPPDFTPFFEYRYLMEEYLGDYDANHTLGAVVFHSNVYLPAPEVMDWEDVSLNRPIEGNGYALDGQLHGTAFDSRLFANGLRAERLRSMCGDDYELVVNNLFIQSYAPISDDSEEAFNDLKQRGGVPYRLDTGMEELANLQVTFRYCLFRYAYMHLNPVSGKMLLDGCIFSNSAGPAIIHHGDYETWCDLTIRNCIFSNTIAPVYLATRGNVGFEKTDDNVYRYTVLHLEGDNYVYNWKLTDEVQMNIFPNTDNENLNAVLAGLNDKISEYLYELLEDPVNKQFVYKHPKGNYINFGFLILSLWSEHNAEFNPTNIDENMGVKYSAFFFDEDKMLYGRLDFAKIEDIIMNKERGIFATLYKMARDKMGIDLVNNKSYLMIPQTEDGEYNTQPGETYNIDEKTKARLHGQEIKK